MKYYLIAGEASGDLHGSNLMKALKESDPEARFRVWGGDLMKAAGGELVKHYRDLAFMGFVEVIANLNTIFKNLKWCRTDILNWQPDVIILIDYPGFNLRISSFAHANGFKVVYYISPQVWAWKSSRVKQIKRDVDLMLVILPFEEEFYRRYNMSSYFVGHPLLDVIAQDSPRTGPVFRERDSRLKIALLPGSRKQEIKTMLPVFLEASRAFPEAEFVIAAAPSQTAEFYHSILGSSKIRLIEGQTYSVLRECDLAWVTSGTATLETGLWAAPQLVCYKGSAISYRIARRLIKVRFISLVNLILDREVVPELIQAQMNPSNLIAESRKILEPGRLEELKRDYHELKEKLGNSGASKRAAAKIGALLNKKGD